MKKTIKAHQEKKTKQSAEAPEDAGAVPAYLLDREQQTQAKASRGKQKQAEKAEASTGKQRQRKAGKHKQIQGTASEAKQNKQKRAKHAKASNGKQGQVETSKESKK